MASMGGYSDEKSRKFFEASKRKDVPLVKGFAQDPQVNPNWRAPGGATPFHNACKFGAIEVVKVLLGLEGLDPDLPDDYGSTPFLFACLKGHVEVVSVLLDDQRIDVNKPNLENESPLWWASMKGHLSVVELLLASGRIADTRGVSTTWKAAAAEVARKEGKDSVGGLIESFERNPVGVTKELRRQLGIEDRDIGRVFALVVFFNDGYLAPKFLSTSSPTTEGFGRTERFFRIASTLPMDLQMVLCHRVFGSAGHVVKTKHSEPAFRELAQMCLHPQ